MSAVPRQDATTRPDTAARRQDTTESQGYNAIKAVRQTAIVSSSSVPDTRFEFSLLQQPLNPTFFDNVARDNVARPFFDNVAPPFFRTPLPELNKYFNSTLQLAFTSHLLLTKKMSQSSSMPASLSTVEDSTQAMGLEGTDLLWMRAISKDPIEQDRLYRLTAQVAFQFLESNYKDAKSIAEVVLLGSVLDRQDYRGVLSSLVRQLEQEPLLESAVLVGVVYFLESAPPGYLIDDDLVRILKVLRKRLEDTHMQLGDTKKPASEPIYLLAIAISRVLDKMVQGNIKGLRRTEDHRPLLNVLAGLKDSSDLCLKYQATCAWQALQYIGDDESPLDMAVRVGGGLVMASLSVAGAFKLDVEGLFNGLRELGEAAGQIRDATETMIAGVQTAREAGEGVVDSLLKGFRTGNKRAWYPALQGARVVISEGRLAEFRRIVYEAPCCHLQEFQWGICQLLGEIAMDPIWVMEIRLQAVYFLENLLRSDSEWTTDSSVKEAIRSILLRISTSGEKTIQIHFNSLSQDSRRENGDDSAEPYPLITRLPTPRSSPLLAKALKAPSLEYELHRFMAHRLEAHQQAAYIPPYAKAHLTASDERFPLMDKVMEFLKSDRQVFLILGDSGSGKTTFNKHLEYVLIKDYKQGSPIPLFIYLPAIRNPEKELISEQLKTLNFTNNDIQELKRDRQFIIICDSYDESRLKINLHMTNMLNQPGQWNVKLIISCRSTHTSANRLHYFQPQPSPVDRYGPSTLHLFQQAVIVPFSEGQIQDYVDQFVRDTELHKALDLRSVWSTAEYMDKLTRIPNLLALVTNPFLLNLSLRSLPVAFKDDLDPLTIARMTRPKLYGIFIDEWLKVNIHRLLCMKHNEATTTKLNELIEAGFNQIAIDFLQNLAKAIYKEQAGNSVVRYVHRDDKETWKAKFFGPEEESTLLRQSSPLTCVENLHSFMHRSLLEYFRSLQMAKLVPTINKRENERVETRSRSMSQTNNQQADLLQKYSTTNDQRKQNNPPSPSLTPSPHQYTQHMMAFSISNALDPESSFTSTNFLANNLERNTLRDACADTSLDAESDGSVSSDDEFEDAQEYLSSDPLERITQDEPHKSFCIRWEEHKVSVSERFTFEVKNYEIVEESSWFRRAVSGVGAAAIGAGALVVGVVRRAAFGAGHAAETDYKLDGPPETVESAKPAFQVTYHENFGVQWEERETAVSESFTYEVKTYETFECVEEIEEIVEETEVVAIIAHEQEIVTEDEVITTETTTTTEGETVLEHVQKDVIVDKKVEVDADVSVEVVDVEVEKKEAKDIIITKETGVVTKPAVPKGTSWFRKIATATGATAVGAGAVAVGAVAVAVDTVHDDASGAGHAAHGALEKVDGVWKRTVQVLTTRKAHVDTVVPIAKTSYVYYDDEVYDAVLVDKSTGVTLVTQLLYDTTTTKYYVYYRWGETDYKLDGPHETVESAKTAFQVTYHENFGVQWEERETAVSERFTYKVKTYETFETTEEVEEIVKETEAVAIIAREQDTITKEKIVTEVVTSTVQDEIVVEQLQEKTVVVDDEIQTKETVISTLIDETIAVEATVEEVVESVAVTEEQEVAKEVAITKETGVIVEPTVTKETSWFRKVVSSAGAAAGAVAVGAGALVVGAGALTVGAIHDVASGAGHAAHGALEKVDGVWKRTVQVLTTRKAHVDAVAPIAKTSYVYYDDEVYDAVLVDKSTGVTHVTQLLYDTTTTKYYVYYRWGETDYKLDGPHETVESAKLAFQVTYHENFGVQWEERETAVSERFTYEVKTYETFETIEEIEEIVEETEAFAIIAHEQEIVTEDEVITTETTTTTEGETVLEHVQKDVIVDKKVEVDADVSVEVVDVEVEKKEAKDIIITKETGVVTKPAVPKGTSWFRKIATATGATAVGAGAVAVGAVAVAVDTVHDDASGAGHAAHGALEKVDGVWKRSVQVLTTRKANVDAVTPIAKTSYVYYDDEVYDAVLVEKSTGITYVTQLLFDSATTKYYVYVRWGETDYKLDGPHDTVESAKAAFQVTYYDQFGVKWQERATTVSERFTYEVKTYETFEAVEVVEEVVDEKAAEVILKPEQEVIVDEETVQTETTTSTTTAHKNENVAEIAYEVEAAPSSSFLKCEISGIPESLGDLTTTSLVFEMRDSPIFDDESLGAMDLEEEQDILQFLVEQVHEDTDYTKLLLWTVYKSLTEGIINQSTKNAACILEKAGIQFQPQL